MRKYCRDIVFLSAALFTGFLMSGCGEQRSDRTKDDSAALQELGPTIESLANFAVPGPMKVEGYGLVSGLKGTGSSECPPRVRAYLSRYIRQQLPAGGNLDVNKYIDRPDTAVVFVEGIMPPLLPKGRYIDVLVRALPGTQTTSLEGGWLFETELEAAGSLGVSMRIPADAKGPIFTDKLSENPPDRRIGHILAGGKILQNRRMMLVLEDTDLEMTNRVRNRINGRYGPEAAKAITAGQIELNVPTKYNQRPQMFIGMVRKTYLTQGRELDQQRIEANVRRLAESPDKIASEVALEAIGNQCLDELSVLLESGDERVRFHAARCTLNLGGERGLVVLRDMALNQKSPFRLDALVAITIGAARNDAAAVSRRLLRDENFLMRLAAYEQLRELDDVAVSQEQVAGTFYIERLALTREKVIFVYRSGQPRVVLFGSPIKCRGNIFLGSADGDITINAPSGADYVTIIRRHPKRPDMITQLRSSFEVGDIVRTLCDDPPKKDEKGHGGLGVSYADAIVLLKQMCDKGAVQAEFRAGPMPNFGLNVKK